MIVKVDDLTLNQNAYRNLQYLTKRRKQSMSWLEGILGVSKGYLSRLAKRNKGRQIGAARLYRASMLFDVPMEDLLTRNLEEDNREEDIMQEIQEKQELLKVIRKEKKC